MNRRFLGIQGISLYTLVDVNMLGEIEPATGQAIGYVSEILENGTAYSVSIQAPLTGRSAGGVAIGDAVKIEGGIFEIDGGGSFRVIETNDNVIKAVPLLSAGGGGGGGYTLPTASQTVKGGIKVGDNLEINGTGFLSAPVATNTGELGVVTVDGTTVLVDPNGVLSASGGGGGYVLPVATDTALGGVKVPLGQDVGLVMYGENLLMNTASDDVLGGIKTGSALEGSPGGQVNVKVDGTTIGINANNELVSLGGGGGSTNFGVKLQTTNPIFTGNKEFSLIATNDFRIISFNMETIISSSYVKGANEKLYQGAGIPGEWFGGVVDSVCFIPIFHAVNPFFPGRPFFSGTIMMQYHGVDDVEIYASFDYSDTSDWNMFVSGTISNPLVVNP